MKVLIVTAVAAMALSAVGSSSASASIVNAKFSSTTVKLTTSGVTIKRNGTGAQTCTAAAINGEVEGSTYYGSNEGLGGTRFSCSVGRLVMRLLTQAKYDTVAERYYLHVTDLKGQSQESPWGPYFQETIETDDWTWVNGSALTPSTITLSEQWVGKTQGTNENITISGTFTAKTSTGGLITLSH